MLRDEPSHITFRPHSVGNRAAERQGKREGGEGGEERPREEEKRKRERLERGRVAFNQSLASKCTVHVYVYKEEGGRKGEVEESGIWFG